MIITKVSEVQMMEDNYAKAYKEIVEIFKYVPEDSVNKIPKEMRDMFEAEQLKTYNFQIDIEKPFEEQELLEETKAILANIFRDYWATDYQKAKIIEKENQDREEWEKQKREKYNSDNIFNNCHSSSYINISENKQEKLLVKIDDMKWYKKLLNKIINFFKK